MSRHGCHDLTTILHTLSYKYEIKKDVLDRLRLVSGHNVHIIIDISYFELDVFLRFRKFEKTIGLPVI